MSRHPGSGPYTLWYGVPALAFQIALVILFLVFDGMAEALQNTSKAMKWVATVTIVILSNVASTYIIGYFKDYVLWPRAGSYPGDTSRSLRDYWRENNHSSDLSGYLGFVERFVVIAAGIVSFEAFYITCGGWLTIKSAIEWKQFVKSEHRVIGHIYLISAVSSLALAAIDVAVVRTIWGLGLL